MKLVNALLNSLRGLKQTWSHENAFQLEVMGCVLILPLLIWIRGEKTDKLFVVFSLALMLIAELLNTALEKANDALKKENDPLIKFSKDAASAAVLISCFLVVYSLLNLIIF